MSTQRLSKIYRQKLKRRFASMDSTGIARPDSFFPGGGEIETPDFSADGFCPIEAWWLVELCRLSYTPDSKEFARVWNASKPDRMEILSDRTPFREVLDVHRTGNSAAIYEMGSGGTVLCFRGTSKPSQWISNLIFHPHEWARFRDPDAEGGGFVHSGFYVMFKRIWPLLWPTLRLAPRPWIFTGHSLGGALAMFANAVAKADKVYTYGAPRTGNGTFASAYSENTIRVVNDRDIVPLLPAKDKFAKDKIFDHAGELFWFSEEGEFVDDFSARAEKQPWNLVEDWSRGGDAMFRRTPAWIKDHLIGQYCHKIAQQL